MVVWEASAAVLGCVGNRTDMGDVLEAKPRHLHCMCKVRSIPVFVFYSVALPPRRRAQGHL